MSFPAIKLISNTYIHDVDFEPHNVDFNHLTEQIDNYITKNQHSFWEKEIFLPDENIKISIDRPFFMEKYGKSNNGRDFLLRREKLFPLKGEIIIYSKNILTPPFNREFVHTNFNISILSEYIKTITINGEALKIIIPFHIYPNNNNL